MESVSALSAGAHTTTLIRDGRYIERGSEKMGMRPPPTLTWADFTLMMECSPESGHHSVLCGLFLYRCEKVYIVHVHCVQSCTVRLKAFV
jgi:hypothetical protein